MLDESIRHVPILDPDGRALDVILLSDLAKGVEPSHHAVIMAGGYGTRLLPLTDPGAGPNCVPMQR